MKQNLNIENVPIFTPTAIRAKVLRHRSRNFHFHIMAAPVEVDDSQRPFASGFIDCGLCGFPIRKDFQWCWRSHDQFTFVFFPTNSGKLARRHPAVHIINPLQA